MPDWRRLVDRRLRRVAISPRRRDEIGRKLAGFLEDSYEERVRLGESPGAAARGAFARAGRWADVVRELERVEGSMRSRLRTLWLPGVVVSMTAIALLLAVGPIRGSLIRLRVLPYSSLLLFWPWLLALPLLGAVGAEWSRRQHGGRRERLLVALFPAFVLMVVYGLTLALTIGGTAHLATSSRLASAAVALLNWVLLPAAALLLGGVQVLYRSETAGKGL